jgi:hypothetical protein
LGRNTKIENKIDEKVEITKERIFEEESLIAFNDIGGLFNRDTGELLPPHELPEEIRRAIASIKVKESKLAGVVTKTYEIKLNEKGRSLDRLQKCFGMQRDTVEIDAVITIKGLLKEIDGQDRGKLPIEMD